MKPRVLFDFSELSSFSHTGARGVRRVVENFAKGLLRQRKFEVDFAGIDHFDRQEVARMLGADATTATHFSRMPQSLHAAALFSLRIGGSALAQSLHRTRIFPGAFYRFAQLVATGARRFPSEAWRGIDIFHSPFAPLPHPKSVPGHVAIFLTLYDLIPLVRPELVGSGSIEQVAAIVRSIHPDTWITCISHAVKKDIVNTLKFPPERIFVTHIAASPETFHQADAAEITEARQRYGLGNYPYILSLGEVERRKNIGHLLASFELMLRDHPDKDLRLVLVGRYAPQSPEFRALRAAHPAVAGRIIFTGFIPNEDLAAIYSGALAFAFPSLAEGFGLPPLEAMQCGVPVISSNTTSLPEVVGDAGILLDPTNQEAWADAIYKLASSDKLRQKLSAQSLARAQHFTWEKTIKTLVSAYEYALAHKS